MRKFGLFFIVFFCWNLAACAESKLSILKDLHKQKREGAITVEEFEKKKQALFYSENDNSAPTHHNNEENAVASSEGKITKKNETPKIEKGMKLDVVRSILGKPKDEVITAQEKGLLHFWVYDQDLYIEYNPKENTVVNWFNAFKNTNLAKFFDSDSSANFSDPLYRNNNHTDNNYDESAAADSVGNCIEFYEIMSEFGISRKAAEMASYEIKRLGLRGENARNYVKCLIGLYYKGV
jgi:hypothetical protein